LDDEGWKKLTQKERELFIHDAAVARGGASNRAQGQERSGLDDEGWEKLTQKERELFIHDAAVARGLLSVEEDGRKAAREAGELDWPSLTAEEKLAFLRISNRTRLHAASAGRDGAVIERKTAIDNMYQATLTMYVDMVMELNPTILTRSSSWAERRRGVRAVMTSKREGDSPGTKHFPGIDKFPSGQLNMSDIAKEFGIGNTNATHSKVECIA
jgi:hypothetical protein